MAESFAQSSPTLSDEPSPSFSWGAFWLNWIWGVGNGIWASLLIIPLGFVPAIIITIFRANLTANNSWVIFLVMFLFVLFIALWFGFKGYSWAWKRKGNLSPEAFKYGEKVWSIIGWLVVGIPAILIVVLMVVTVIIISSYAGAWPKLGA